MSGSRYKKGSLLPQSKFILDVLSGLKINQTMVFVFPFYNYQTPITLRAGIHDIKYRHLPMLEIKCKIASDSVTVKRIK